MALGRGKAATDAGGRQGGRIGLKGIPLAVLLGEAGDSWEVRGFARVGGGEWGQAGAPCPQLHFPALGDHTCS